MTPHYWPYLPEANTKHSAYVQLQWIDERREQLKTELRQLTETAAQLKGQLDIDAAAEWSEPDIAYARHMRVLEA